MSENEPTGQAHPEPDEDAQDTALAKKIFIALFLIVTVWGAAIFKWGVPGLYIPALASVPLIYLVLIIVARG